VERRHARELRAARLPHGPSVIDADHTPDRSTQAQPSVVCRSRPLVAVGVSERDATVTIGVTDVRPTGVRDVSDRHETPQEGSDVQERLVRHRASPPDGSCSRLRISLPRRRAIRRYRSPRKVSVPPADTTASEDVGQVGQVPVAVPGGAVGLLRPADFLDPRCEPGPGARKIGAIGLDLPCERQLAFPKASGMATDRALSRTAFAFAGGSAHSSMSSFSR
jgi:hypothetical protein